MSEEAKREYQEQLLKEEMRIMEEINNNPDLRDVTTPPEIRDSLFEAIHAKEASNKEETDNRLTERETELIRLGKLYEKKRKKRKYLVLAAVLVLAMAFGITSLGGAEKIFEKVTWMISGREQEIINSGDTSSVKYVDEEEVYEEIEEEYGFLPVRMMYLPKGVKFQEATVSEEIQKIYIVYGKDNGATILYTIRPNYRESSYGSDVEDEILEEYEKIIDDIVLSIKKYQIEGGISRWTVKYAYQDVTYSIAFTGIEEKEMQKVIENLYFF